MQPLLPHPRVRAGARSTVEGMACATPGAERSRRNEDAYGPRAPASSGSLRLFAPPRAAAEGLETFASGSAPFPVQRRHRCLGSSAARLAWRRRKQRRQDTRPGYPDPDEVRSVCSRRCVLGLDRERWVGRCNIIASGSSFFRSIGTRLGFLARGPRAPDAASSFVGVARRSLPVASSN